MEHDVEPLPQALNSAPAPPEAERLLALLTGLVAELHPGRATRRVVRGSRLDRDLGLDSVSRIELLERLERAFSRHVAEEAVLRAETVADLVEALALPSDPTPRDSLDALKVGAELTDQVSADVKTLVEALAWHAHTHPQRIHAQFVGAEHETQILRYGELYESAQRLAAGLCSRGVKPGDRVALMLPTGADYLRSFCAALLLGAVPVPLYPPSQPALLEEHMARQQRILENAQPTIMITVREALPLARAMKRALPFMRHVVSAADLPSTERLPNVRVGPEDLAFLQYTSGSTGDPKGVMLSHANLMANIRAMVQTVQVSSEDVMVSWLPLYHDMGLIGGWLTGLYFGFPVVLMSPLHFLGAPARWLRVMHKVSGTLSCAPNFAYELCVRRIADADLAGVDLSRWRFALNGSEPISAHTLEAFCTRFERFGFRRGAMSPAYGLAECSVALTFPPLMRGPRIDRVLREPLVRRGRAEQAREDADPTGVMSLVACGRPLPGHEVRIVDAGGHACREREIGEIEFRGPSATQGYYRRPEETERLFHEGWLRTGDLGYIADGDLYLSGRSKDMIIRAGQHIFPQELEEAVGGLPGVRKGCVAAFPSIDPRAQTERLILVAETHEKDAAARAELITRIHALATELLGAPPDEVLLVAPRSVPKTSSGKLRRSACRLAYEQGTLGRPPRPPLLQWLRLRARGSVPPLRETLRASSALLYAAYAWLCFALVAGIAWLLVLVLPRAAWRSALARRTARALGVLTRTGLSVQGLAHLPEGACVLVANHQSNVDPFVLYAALPRVLCVVAKSELSEHWWTRLALDRLGVEYVKRTRAAEGIADARRIQQRAHAGELLVFFPEGTHARNPGLLPFHMGAFVTAARASLPVVPIAIHGTRAILRSDTYLPRRGAIRVTIGEPLLPEGTDFAAALRLKEAARAFMLEQVGEPDLG